MTSSQHSRSGASEISGSGERPGGEAWTIARVLRWAAEDLARRGAQDSPRLDAELLLGHALGLDRVRLIVDSNRPLTPEELARFRELIVRRRRSEPIAYILGEREFYGMRFNVNQHVLIPRPDTETLVTVALERTRAQHLFGRALDVCTGSGCVAVAFAKERPTWHVTGSDISGEALEVARKNALRLGTIWNVAFVESDLLAGIRAGTPATASARAPVSGTPKDAAHDAPNDALELRFDLITANPPYIPDAEVPELSADIRNFEPHAALCGGADGLAILRRLVKAAPSRLVPGGVLAMEVGAGQAERVAKGLASYGFADVQQDRDYGGIDRVVSGRWPG
jgi:release factor glutamine methyltransferase